MLEDKTQAPAPPAATRRAEAITGRLLELSIPDAHFGKLAWWRECGQSYDTDIAKRLFVEAIEDLIVKTSAFGPFDTIALVVGNDLLNADSFENTTARGTPQSTDGRQQKTFWIVREVITHAIETLLRPLAKQVKVVMVAGNHDLQTNFYLGEVLAARFHNYDDVVIDNSPAQRKYLEHGQCLLMLDARLRGEPLLAADDHGNRATSSVGPNAVPRSPPSTPSQEEGDIVGRSQRGAWRDGADLALSVRV